MRSRETRLETRVAAKKSGRRFFFLPCVGLCCMGCCVCRRDYGAVQEENLKFAFSNSLLFSRLTKTTSTLNPILHFVP